MMNGGDLTRSSEKTAGWRRRFDSVPGIAQARLTERWPQVVPCRASALLYAPIGNSLPRIGG